MRPAPGDKQPNLPLGDDKVTSTSPRVGWLYACESFADVAGAVAAAPWIKGSIWYPERKPAVLGGVLWDDAYIKITVADADRVIRTMGVPVGINTSASPPPSMWSMMAAWSPRNSSNPKTVRSTERGEAVAMSAQSARQLTSNQHAGADCIAHRLPTRNAPAQYPTTAKPDEPRKQPTRYGNSAVAT